MKTVFMFSGQGAQYPGMLRYLYDNFDSCKRVVQVANSVLGRDISKIMFDGPSEELNKTENTQPCVLAADIMAYEALKELGYHPSAVAGFSLGEYGAIYASGVLDLKTIFEVIDVRARAMKESCKDINGSMAAIIGCDKEKVIDLCGKASHYVVPVNFNCTGQISISGEDEGINEVFDFCKQEKIRAIKLQVSVPCHCKFMNHAAVALEKKFNEILFAKPSIPIYMNVDGRREEDENIIKEKLVRQIKEPVQWIDTLNNLYSENFDTFVECGPGKTLSTFVKRTINGVTFINVENEQAFEETKQVLRGE